ncbi:hypothetical protein F4779DRAFT_350307 [Xylariaceae sp. FL0662B]|nr:hypothetical protein F4779DRAFT_350307 [Xylariaceae sp. FL0662B]
MLYFLFTAREYCVCVFLLFLGICRSVKYLISLTYFISYIAGIISNTYKTKRDGWVDGWMMDGIHYYHPPDLDLLLLYLPTPL